jgi:hypothetical protein
MYGDVEEAKPIDTPEPRGKEVDTFDLERDSLSI